MLTFQDLEQLRTTGHILVNNKEFYNIASLDDCVLTERILSLARSSKLFEILKQRTDEQTALIDSINVIYFAYLYGLLRDYELNEKVYKIIPGHFYADDSVDFGPIRPCDVLIIGEAPSYAEMHEDKNLVGDYGKFLFEELCQAGLPEGALATFYLCNVIRIPFYPKDKQNELIKDFLPLLKLELKILKPKFIICLGTTAKKVFTTQALSLLSRTPISYKYEINGNLHEAKLFGFPLTALHENRDALDLKRAARFWVNHVYFNKPIPPQEIPYEVINSADVLEKIVNDILSKPGLKRIAIDLEWNGRIYSDNNGAVRIIGFSDSTEKAYVVEVSDTSGNIIFSPDLESLAHVFNRLILDDSVQIIGHNFYSDFPWLESLGINISKKWWFPSNDDELCCENYPGIFDTIIAHHAYDESGIFDLEISSEIYLGVQKWSSMLENFIKDYIKEHKILRRQLPGYGMIPNEILYPYSAKDVVNCLRLFKVHVENLHKTRNLSYPKDPGSWKPYWTNMKALPGFIEMYKTGILIDKERLDKLTQIFVDALKEEEERFRKQINWPTFNYRSSQQSIALLFGDEYVVGKKKILPDGAKCFHLKPVKTTSTYGGKPWQSNFIPGEVSPATDIETCNILEELCPEINGLKRLRLLDHAINTVLCPTEGDEETSGGLAFYICDDGRIHPTYFPLRETRRCSCKNPNLQNLAKSREEEYRLLLRDKYIPIRSVFTADPRHKFVNVDLSAAELLMMGLSSMDEGLLRDYYKSGLPDTDEHKLDIHSKIAVLSFKLPCAPTKESLERSGKLHLRFAAKRIIFGLNYGMGVQSFRLLLRNDGVSLQEEEIEKIIETIYKMYPKVKEYQENVKRRVVDVGWMRNCFGSFRHFPRTRNSEIISNKQREALNFPCQSGVADAVSLIMHNLMTHELKTELDYKLVMHNHDALVFLVPEKNIIPFVNTVLEDCIRKRLELRPHDLDGIPASDKTYHFNYEVEVTERL